MGAVSWEAFRIPAALKGEKTVNDFLKRVTAKRRAIIYRSSRAVQSARDAARRAAGAASGQDLAVVWQDLDGRSPLRSDFERAQASGDSRELARVVDLVRLCGHEVLNAQAPSAGADLLADAAVLTVRRIEARHDRFVRDGAERLAAWLVVRADALEAGRVAAESVNADSRPWHSRAKAQPIVAVPGAAGPSLQDWALTQTGGALLLRAASRGAWAVVRGFRRSVRGALAFGRPLTTPGPLSSDAYGAPWAGASYAWLDADEAAAHAVAVVCELVHAGRIVGGPDGACRLAAKVAIRHVQRQARRIKPSTWADNGEGTPSGGVLRRSSTLDTESLLSRLDQAREARRVDRLKATAPRRAAAQFALAAAFRSLDGAFRLKAGSLSRFVLALRNGKNVEQASISAGVSRATGFRIRERLRDGLRAAL